MRIGIDARCLTHPQPGGFKTYTTNLVGALGDVDHENEYVIYVDRRPSDPGALPAHPNFTYKTVAGTLPGVGMALREQVLLRRQVAVDRLDLVHFLCNTATVGLRTPHVVTLHDAIQLTPTAARGRQPSRAAPWGRLQAAYSRYVIRQAARWASRLITVSRHERDAIRAVLDIARAPVLVVYLAPALVFTAAHAHAVMSGAPPTGLPPGVHPPYMLGVGYEPRKNIELLIDIFAGLAGELCDLQLVVVAASGVRQRALQARLSAKGLGPRGVILGALPTVCLARLYRHAEVFVFPSEREGFGLPPLEAMASGIPTIAMRASAVPEVVGDGALLVDGAAVEAWVSAVRGVLSNPSVRDGVVQRGLARAAMFSWTRCAQETCAVYRAAYADGSRS